MALGVGRRVAARSEVARPAEVRREAVKAVEVWGEAVQEEEMLLVVARQEARVEAVQRSATNWRLAPTAFECFWRIAPWRVIRSSTRSIAPSVRRRRRPHAPMMTKMSWRHSLSASK